MLPSRLSAISLAFSKVSLIALVCCRTVTKGGKQYLEPCSGGTPGAIETDLNKLADEGKASMVAPPSITMSMMRKVLEKARPTVSQSDLETYQKFTKEFGEEG